MSNILDTKTPLCTMSESTSTSNWKAIRDGGAERRGAHWEKVTLDKKTLKYLPTCFISCAVFPITSFNLKNKNYDYSKTH